MIPKTHTTVSFKVNRDPKVLSKDEGCTGMVLKKEIVCALRKGAFDKLRGGKIIKKLNNHGRNNRLKNVGNLRVPLHESMSHITKIILTNNRGEIDTDGSFELEEQ